MLKKVKKFVRGLLPYIVVFIACIYKPIDPDLGWHLKYGEYFFTSGQVLRDNILSTEMPDYKWANIAWGIDLINYAIFQAGGFFGLSLAGALVATLTFFFFAKAYKLDYWQKAIIFPLLLYLLSTIHANSFRGQLVSIMLLGILVYVIKRYEDGVKKVLYFVPLLMLFWANLHGLFIMGLGIFFLWETLFVATKYLKDKAIKPLLPDLKLLVPVSVATLLTPLIHPFGIGVYAVAIEHFDSPLLDYITEYNPVAELSNHWYHLIVVGVLFAIGSITFYLKKTVSNHTSDIGLFSVLYFFSFSTRKYLWAMYYFIIPFAKPVADFIRPESKNGVFYGATLLFIITLGFVLVLKQPFTQFTTMTWKSYCNVFLRCSDEAVSQLKEYYIEGKTLTPYAWGGYIIWNHPDIKPAVDGRMSVWTDEKGYSGFEYTFNYEWDRESVNQSKFDVVLAAKNRPIYDELVGQTRFGSWRKVYEDQSSGIFVRVLRPDLLE